MKDLILTLEKMNFKATYDNETNMLDVYFHSGIVLTFIVKKITPIIFELDIKGCGKKHSETKNVLLSRAELLDRISTCTYNGECYFDKETDRDIERFLDNLKGA